MTKTERSQGSQQCLFFFNNQPSPLFMVIVIFFGKKTLCYTVLFHFTVKFHMHTIYKSSNIFFFFFLIYFWVGLGSPKHLSNVSIILVWDIDVENNPIEFWKNPRSTMIQTKWPLISLKGYKDYRKVNIELIWDIDVESNPVMFGKDPSLPKRVIMLTR